MLRDVPDRELLRGRLVSELARGNRVESLRKVPGLDPDQAADIIAKAIIDRPRTIAPWWLWPAEVATVAMRSPIERVTQVWYRRTRDSERRDR